MLACVFALKLAVLAQLHGHPLLQPDAGLDTTAYVNLARRVLAGDLFLGPGLYFVSPLYIYVLAAGLKLTGSYTAIRAGQLLLGTVSVAGIFLMARDWFGSRAGWIAAILAAATGMFTFYEGILLQSSLDPVLTSGALFALTRGLKAGGRRWFVLSGLVFGVDSLNRPNMLIAAAVVVLALCAIRRLRPGLLLAAGIVMALLPVAVRNVMVAHQWSLLSSHGGLNLYIGNSATATGFYHPVPGISPTITGQESDARRVAETAEGRPLSDAEVSSYFTGLSEAWMTSHPADAIALLAKKFAYVFSAQHVALPHSYPFYAYDAGTLLRYLFIGPWLLIPLGLVGLIVCAPAAGADRGIYVVWAAFVPAYAFAVAVFFVAERYRLPLLVPLSVGAGALIDRVWMAAGRHRLAALAPTGALVLALGTLSNWPTGLQNGRWEEGLRMAQRLVILGRFDEADEWTRRAVSREPTPGATDYGVGEELLRVGQPARAVDHLARAHAGDPTQPDIDYAYGEALTRSGRAQEALPHLRHGFDAGIPLPSAGLDYATALHESGDSAAAAAVLKRMRPADSSGADAWLAFGRLAAEAHAPELAETFFRRAVRMQPGDAASHQQLGLDLLVLTHFDAAAAELAEAVRLDPHDADSLSRLAYAEYQIGRLGDARTHVRAALALSPGDPFTLQLARGLGMDR